MHKFQYFVDPLSIVTPIKVVSELDSLQKRDIY